VISVIIPAYNEGAVIGRLLEAITAGTRGNELDIVVVCNGCTDDTGRIARQFGDQVRVLETSVASKPYALNLGDHAAKAFPRLYVDADVIITINTIRALACRLQKGDVLAAAPRAQFDLTNSSSLVRAFFKIQSQLPSVLEGIGGSGVYGLSEIGRRRFEEFPAITADDGYVRIQFTPAERVTLDSLHSVVFAPRNIKSLISIKSRSHFGSYELAKCYPALWQNRGASNHDALLRLFLNPRLWPALFVYCFVALEAKRQAKARMRKNGQTWQRDHSSRHAPARYTADS